MIKKRIIENHMKTLPIILGVYIGVCSAVALAQDTNTRKTASWNNNNNQESTIRQATIGESPDSLSETDSLPDDLTIEKEFIIVDAYNINGQDYQLPISRDEYLQYKKMPHTANNPSEFVQWATYMNPTIHTIASFLTKDAKTPEEKADILLTFVQSNTYDNSTEQEKDYVRYPIETIVDQKGDCEDFAILGATLMKSIGLDVALIYYPADSGLISDISKWGKNVIKSIGLDDRLKNSELFDNNGHVGLGVAGEFTGTYFVEDGKTFFYAEATPSRQNQNRTQWKIGQMPKEHAEQNAFVYVVH
jgi:hypothetical protein